MAKITTPVKGFTGKVVGVTFADGVGETEDEAAVSYFRRHGYGVEVASKPADKPIEKWTKAELLEHAKAHGIDLGDAKKNDEIVAIIKAAGVKPSDESNEENSGDGSDGSTPAE